MAHKSWLAAGLGNSDGVPPLNRTCTPLVRAGTWLSHLDCGAPHEESGFYVRALGQSNTFVRYDSRSCGLSNPNRPLLTFEAAGKNARADKLQVARESLIRAHYKSADLHTTPADATLLYQPAPPPQRMA